MSIERNKQLATEFFARLTAQDVVGALGLMSDDATWWIAGKPEASPYAGVYDKARLGRLFASMGKRLKAGLAMSVKSAIGEGDKVAMEVESLGALTNGRTYQQQYHFLIEFREGKISSVKEYLDTQHVHAAWVAAADEKAA
jgi:uncharacterized protein